MGHLKLSLDLLLPLMSHLKRSEPQESQVPHHREGNQEHPGMIPKISKLLVDGCMFVFCDLCQAD